MGPESELKAYLAQSDAYIREGRWSDERDLMAVAISKFPDNAEIVIRFAGASAEVSPDLSAEYAAKAAVLAPEDPVILVRAASLLLGLGEVEKAGPLARRASEMVDEDFVLIADLFHVIGCLGLARDNEEVAERYLRLAFDADPGAPSHGEVLAGFLVQQERLDEAREVVNRALSEGTSDREKLLRLEDLISAAEEP